MIQRKPYKRKDRLSKLIQQEIVSVIEKNVRDPRVGRLAVTDVEIREDMKTALVKVCRRLEGEFVEPDAKQRRECIQGLQSAAPFIFEQVKRRVPIKRLPWFEYKYDQGLEGAAKVWALMGQLDGGNS